MSNLIGVTIENLVSLSQSFSHNFRFQKPSYLVNDSKNIHVIYNEEIEQLKPIREDFDNFQKILEEKIRNDYFKHNNQKMQAKTILFKEALVSFGRECFEKNDINDINQTLQKFITDFEKQNNVKVLSHSIHLDEGHEENGIIKHNYHAHFQIMNYDFKTHKTGMRKANYKKLQTDLANRFKNLGFERGKDYSGLQKIENDKAKAENRKPEKIKKPKHVKHADYRRIMQSQELENQRKELKQLIKDIDYKKLLNKAITKKTENLNTALKMREQTSKKIQTTISNNREKIEDQKKELKLISELIDDKLEKFKINGSNLFDKSIQNFERLPENKKIEVIKDTEFLANRAKQNNDQEKFEYYNQQVEDYKNFMILRNALRKKEQQKIQHQQYSFNIRKDKQITR